METEQQPTNGVAHVETKPPEPTIVEVPEADEAEAPAAETPVERQTRAEKKAARGAIREENDRLRQELDSAQERQRQFEVQLAELRGHVTAQSQRVTESNGDPYTGRLKNARDRAQQVLAMVGQGQASMDQYQDAIDEYNDLRMESKGQRNGHSQGMTAEQIDHEITKRSLEASHPWLPHNPQARRWADGQYDQLVAEGRPEGIATMNEALSAAGARFSLGGTKAPPVSDAQRRLYAGVSSRDTGGGGGGVRVQLDEDSKRLAEAKWPNATKQQAWKNLSEMMARKARERGEI